MHIYAVDRRLEMRKAVDPRFLRAPVIAIRPIGTKLFEVVDIGAVIPASVVRHFVPRVSCNPGKNGLKHIVGDVELKR